MKKMGISKTTYHMEDEHVQQLKGKTLIVILPQSQYNYIDQYNEMMGSAWTLTPVKAIKYNELPDYSDVNKYSFLKCEALKQLPPCPRAVLTRIPITFFRLLFAALLSTKRGKKRPTLKYSVK
jgi:hypothetical protein